MNLATKACLIPLWLSQCACAGVYISAVNAGFVAPTSPREGHAGGALDVHSDVGGSRPGSIAAGGGGALRLKGAPQLVQVALGPELFFASMSSVGAYLRCGVHLLQFESADRQFAFGLGSPYGSLGLKLPLRGSRGFTLFLAGSVEYDVRLSGAPSNGYFGATIGIGESETSQ